MTLPIEYLKARFKIAIKENCLRTDGPFTLASGKVSNYYLDLGKIVCQPHYFRMIGDILADTILSCEHCVGGVVLGGLPIAISASYSKGNYHDGEPEVFWVRPEKPPGKRLEGNWYDGGKAVMIEDVTTTGNSLLRACLIAREEGNMQISRAFTIVDRLEGASDLLSSNGITLQSVFTVEDFGIEL